MNRRISLFPFLVLVLCVMAVTAVLTHHLDSRMSVLSEEARVVRLEQIALEGEASALEQELSRKDQNSYIIQVARSQYGYLMPGELRFHVTNINDLYATHEVIPETAEE